MSSREQKILQATIDASFDAMLSIDESGIILTANKAATTVFGYDRDEFLGQNISMICGKDHAPHHDQYLKNYLETGITKIIGTKREVPARKKNGDEFPVELGIVDVNNEGNDRFFCCFVKDLTEQKKNEQEIKLRESLAQGLLNCAFDPMIQINEKGIICIVNDSTCNLFGYDRDELIGMNISQLCGTEKGIDHSERHAKYISTYLETGRKKIMGTKRPTSAKRKDGTEFEIQLAISEVKNPISGELMFCGYIRDMTEVNGYKKGKQRQDALIQSRFFQKAEPPNTDAEAVRKRREDRRKNKSLSPPRGSVVSNRW